MDKLEIAKKIIKGHYNEADCGIFDCRNLIGDRMTNIYDENGLCIDICYHYAYFEVFGLTDEEFAKLKIYYEKLAEETERN